MPGPIDRNPSPASLHYPIQQKTNTQVAPPSTRNAPTDTRALETLESKQTSGAGSNAMTFSMADTLTSLLKIVLAVLDAFRKGNKEDREALGKLHQGALQRGADLLRSSGSKQMLGAVIAGATQIVGSVVAFTFSVGAAAKVGGALKSAGGGIKYGGGVLLGAMKSAWGGIKHGGGVLLGAMKGAWGGIKHGGGALLDAMKSAKGGTTKELISKVAQQGARAAVTEGAARRTAVLPDVVRTAETIETLPETITYQPAPSAASGDTASAADKGVKSEIHIDAKKASKAIDDANSRIQRDTGIGNSLSMAIASTGGISKAVLDNTGTEDQAKKAEEDAIAEGHRTARDIANSAVQTNNEHMSNALSTLGEAMRIERETKTRILV